MTECFARGSSLGSAPPARAAFFQHQKQLVGLDTASKLTPVACNVNKVLVLLASIIGFVETN